MIDVFYDNVGGKILNEVLRYILLNVCVVICGGILCYEIGGMLVGLENYFNFIFKWVLMIGFLLIDYVY